MQKRRSRRGFLGGALAAGVTAGLAPGSAARGPGATESGKIRVDNGIPSAAVAEAVLFPFDDYSVPFSKGLVLALVRGSKGPGDYAEGASYDPDHPGKPVLRLGAAGEPDSVEALSPVVIRVGDEYRMWYVCRGDSSPGAGPHREGGKKIDPRRQVAYAVSRDGLRWEKPQLGIVEYAGSRRNNLVDLAGGNGFRAVLHDPADPDPGRRFKAAYQTSPMRLSVAYSPDGLRWRPSPGNPVGGGIELGYLCPKFNGCYYVNGQGGPSVLNKIIPHPIVAAGKRDMITYASYDFEHWTQAAVLSFRRASVPPRPPADFEMHRGEQVHEGAHLWDRGNVFVGLYGQYHNETNDRRFATMDIGLVVSNDVLHMREPIPDFKMVSWHEELETQGQLGVRLMPGGGIENIGERTIHWYSTWEYPPRGEIRVATWQRDRLGYFAAVSRREFTGPGRIDVPVDPHLVTCPLRGSGAETTIEVNADGLSQHSTLAVEVLDEQFRPLPEYRAESCVPLVESGLRQAVRWRGRPRLQALERPFRIRVNWGGVRPEDARLYAIYVR
jgi:hypothetical protein